MKSKTFTRLNIDCDFSVKAMAFSAHIHTEKREKNYTLPSIVEMPHTWINFLTRTSANDISLVLTVTRKAVNCLRLQSNRKLPTAQIIESKQQKYS